MLFLVSKITYYVSSVTLNPTHYSLRLLAVVILCLLFKKYYLLLIAFVQICACFVAKFEYVLQCFW